MGAHTRLVKTNESRFKKRFGQHFLRDSAVIERIVRWLQPSEHDAFIEIGAGDGALSSRLAPRSSRLLAIEIDTDCIPRLESALEPFPSASVVVADILHLDIPQFIKEKWKPGTRLRIAGNLPYNIATVIIERLLRLQLPIHDMSFMVQLEVAERITAVPRTRQYGYFSVLCQHYAETRPGFRVSSACFVPRPKVSSAMVSLHPKPQVWEPHLQTDFQDLIKAAFSYRRKTLENSLAIHPAFRDERHILLQRAGIDGTRRAESLSVFEYEHLAQFCSELRGEHTQ
jgi:16S rRNA (adenine1518-N6/adenine1519-N6)-dimethyltransferase